MEFSGNRQQFLEDQGYGYEKIKNLCDQADALAVSEGYAFAPKDDQELLEAAMEEMNRRR